MHDQGLLDDAMQLNAPLGGLPRGASHVLAAAASGEAAGSPAPAGGLQRGARPSARREAVEWSPQERPGAARKPENTSCSQYRCSSQPTLPLTGFPEHHFFGMLAPKNKFVSACPSFHWLPADAAPHKPVSFAGG